MSTFKPTKPVIIETSGTRYFEEKAPYTMCKREYVIASRSTAQATTLEPKIYMDIAPEHASRVERILTGIEYKKEDYAPYVRFTVTGQFNSIGLLTALKEDSNVREMGDSEQSIVSRENLAGIVERANEITPGIWIGPDLTV